MRKLIIIILLLCIGMTGCGNIDAVLETTGIFADGIIEYQNDEYGFTLSLPISWEGYTALTEEWQGYHLSEMVQTGLEIIIRNPTWTEEDQYQDIPVMVFTHDQWGQLGEDEGFHVSAGGSPSEIGRNSEYVFALRPRYDHMEIRGTEEVRNIIRNEGFYSGENING